MVLGKLSSVNKQLASDKSTRARAVGSSCWARLWLISSGISGGHGLQTLAPMTGVTGVCDCRQARNILAASPKAGGQACGWRPVVVAPSLLNTGKPTKTRSHAVPGCVARPCRVGCTYQPPSCLCDLQVVGAMPSQGERDTVLSLRLRVCCWPGTAGSDLSKKSLCGQCCHPRTSRRIAHRWRASMLSLR